MGFDPAVSTLWPWQPDREPRKEYGWFRGADAAETAGWWYETRDGRRHQEHRHRTLAQIVRSETSRNRQATRNCEADLRGFEDPDRYRRWAEALLAGLTHAQRVGEGIRVPDPRDPEGADLVVPVPPAVGPAKAAEQLFGKHRRGLRGLRRATERLEALELRGRELAALEQRFAAPDCTEEQCIAEMRRLRLPVALEPDTRAGRAASRGSAPRMEGVRVYYAKSGEMILAGKGGRENHRLTFKLASPHDFWLHAMGVGGAHVILRNDSRTRQPGPALAEAAAIAAFHSQASSQPSVDVQWTLRKNVKKPRGAKPGTVVLKRFETIRVRPRIPS
jgi:predicted ribosome quality control (RQC) complex YloA/Tae2 family protein